MTTPRHILFPYDFSNRARDIVPFVGSLACRTGARVTLFSVVPPTFDSVPADMGDDIRTGLDAAVWVRNLQTKLDGALADAFPRIPVERVATGGDPGIRIVAFAASHNVDLIMMPTHGLGALRTMLIGSVTAQVLHDAACPVWTAAHAETQTAAPLPRTILCALDESDATPALIQWASEFSRGVGAALTFLHVVDAVTDWPSLASEQRLQEEVRREAHDRVASMLKQAAVDAPLRVPVGPIVERVVDEVQQGADLVIVGRGAAAGPLAQLRTHAFGIIERSPCPVISV